MVTNIEILKNVELILQVKKENLLLDPDTLPILNIKDSTNTLIDTLTNPQRIYKGVFKFLYKFSYPGEFILEFVYIINGKEERKEEFIKVKPPIEDENVSKIIIRNWDLDLIKSVIGKPLIEKFALTDDDIKKYSVFPAFIDYFTKFPLKEEQQVSLSGYTEIPFPDEYTYGLIDSRIVGKGESYEASSFWDIIRYQSLFPNIYPRSIGSYGTTYDFNQVQALNIMARTVFNTYQNMGTYKVKIDYENKKVIAHSSINATFNFTWAKYSLDFRNIKFERYNDVIKLCQMYLLNLIIDFASLYEDSQIDRRINVDALRQKAESIYNEVIKENWRMIPDVILLRSELL